MSASSYGYAGDPRVAAPTAVVDHGINEHGRDFVVGDIHTQWEWLSMLLDGLQFDQNRDRCFSVGDLVDRGEHSARTPRWLSCPWFLPVRGNHDQMVIENHLVLGYERPIIIEGSQKHFQLQVSSEPSDQERLRLAQVVPGSQTAYYHLDHREHSRQLAETLRTLPYAREIATELGRVVIVHTNIPCEINWIPEDQRTSRYAAQTRRNLTWADCRERLEHHDQGIIDRCQWSTHRDERDHDGRGPEVPDADLIVGGHDYFVKTRLKGDYLNIDYGAGHRTHHPAATLCAVQIHPGTPRMFHYGYANEKTYRQHRNHEPGSIKWRTISYQKEWYEGFRETEYPPRVPGYTAEYEPPPEDDK